MSTIKNGSKISNEKQGKQSALKMSNVCTILKTNKNVKIKVPILDVKEGLKRDNFKKIIHVIKKCRKSGKIKIDKT